MADFGTWFLLHHFCSSFDPTKVRSKSKPLPDVTKHVTLILRACFYRCSATQRMQNIVTREQHVSSLPLGTTHAIFAETLHTLQQSSHVITLHTSTKSHEISTTSNPVALTFHNGCPLLATRKGEMITLADNNVMFVGDVTDASPDKSGILSLRASNDGCVLIVVSPVSITVLDSQFETVAQFALEGIATEADVAWRSDGDFFVVVYRSDRLHGVTVDRTFETLRNLQIDDLSLRCSVSWEPRAGGAICISGPGKGLTFFETNGLRHNRSDFQPGVTKLMRWSYDARILATADNTSITLWTRSNYHWYNKKTLYAGEHIVDVIWDEDDVSCAHIITSKSRIDLRISIEPSCIVGRNTNAYAVVIDGCNLMVTNLSKAVIPPPISHGIITLGSPVDCVCDVQGAIGALRSDGVFEVISFPSPLYMPCTLSANPISNTIRKQCELLDWDFQKPGMLSLRMLTAFDNDLIALVGCSNSSGSKQNDVVSIYHTEASEAETLTRFEVNDRISCLSKSCVGSLLLSTSEKYIMNFNIASGSCITYGQDAKLCMDEGVSVIDVKVAEHRILTVVSDRGEHLQVIDASAKKVLYISSECTSFLIHADFLLFTTRSHLLYCVFMKSNIVRSSTDVGDKIPSVLDELESASNVGDDPWLRVYLEPGLGAIRPIDRGSLLIAGIPGDVSIVLEAPRGNLETFAPRPLVFEAVNKYAKTGYFAKAFHLCRRQRVDMNHLVDADYERFLKSVPEFIRQIGRPEHLNVFLSLLKGDTSKINSICDSVVSELKSNENAHRFITTILTGFVKRDPPDLSGALEQVRECLKVSSETANKAVDYLFVILKNEETVYNHALGMYDLNLASLIAESSQMDPAEFSKELQRLNDLDENLRKYTIDMKLRRYDGALRHLYACGSAHFEKCVTLCQQHDLYETAFELLKDEESLLPDLLNGYGHYLQRIHRFDDAAAAFARNNDWRNASICYRKSGRWEFSINAVSRCKISEEQSRVMWEEICMELVEGGRVIEAARMRAGLFDDIEGSLELLVGHEEWDGAIEVVTLWEMKTEPKRRGTNSALLSQLADSVLEGYESLIVTLRENFAKLRERRNRLETVRESKRAIRERLLNKPIGNADAGSDLFSTTTASSVASHLSDVTFTSKTSGTSLYTSIDQTGELSSAKLQKQAERRKRKAAKRRITQGHPREEEALLEYVQELVPKKHLLSRLERMSRALLYFGKPDLVHKLMTLMCQYTKEVFSLPPDVVTEENQMFLQSPEWRAHSNVSQMLSLGTDVEREETT